MTYYFVPGRLFELSYSELISVLPKYIKDYRISTFENIILLDTEVDPFVLKTVFQRLGGFVSCGKIIDITDDFISIEDKTKIVFSFNYHFNGKRKYDYNTLKKLAEGIKKNLKSKGVSAKYLLSNSLKIDAFNVERNKILEKGFLLEIFDFHGQIKYGIALEIQDAEKFSKIEYEKPFTDNKMGVLPFKLAKILVNLGQVKEGDTIWDPFCGSGTILLSAFDMGINVIGSDVENKAVKMSQENINWLATQNNDNQTKFNIFRMDITKPDKFVLSLLRKTEINALACEPYMGPPLLSQISPAKAREYLNGVKEMYSSLFSILEHSKLKSFTAVIVIPSYRTAKGWVTISVNEIVSKKWTIKNKNLGGDLQWSRPDSIIRRNIFVLFKGD